MPTDKEFEFMIAHSYEHNTSNVVKTFLSRNTIMGQISDEQKSILISMPTSNLDLQQEFSLPIELQGKKNPERSILR